jgi:ADP-dependent NAD(P)H-hydrate dehydratase / NAD(P)H-hydrate epimerase
MITIKQMQLLEMNSEFFGVSKLKLMQNAGYACAKEIKKVMLKKKIKKEGVLVIAGQGNNGGDGMVIAKELGCNIFFVGKKDKLKKEALVNYKKLNKKQFLKSNQFDNALSDAKIIIDALLGTGIKGKIKNPYDSVIRKVNIINAYKISIDVPSGFNVNDGKGSLFIIPNLLLELHDNKLGKHLIQLKNKKNKVQTKVIDIGIPEKAILGVGLGEVNLFFENRNKTAHKGDHGKVLLIAGSEEYPGAAVLTGKAALNASKSMALHENITGKSVAALRSGVDLVTIAAPSNVGWIIHKYLPDLIIKKFPGNYLTTKNVNEIVKIAKNNDVVVFGPGFGRKSDSFIKGFIKEISKLKNKSPFLVLDADALKAITKKELKLLKNAILTPHLKEFELLFGEKLVNNLDKKIKVITKYSKKYPHLILLVKGNPDIIALNGTIKLNYTGGPSMTVGGTGDVLAGLCAGIAAQSVVKKVKTSKEMNHHLFNSACIAAFVNGLAGDQVYKVLGNGLIASDLLKEIALVIKKYSN